MYKFLKHLRPFVWPIILVVILTFLQVMANLQLPKYMAQIVDQGILQSNQPVIYRSGLSMIVITVIGSISAAAAGFVTARISAKLAKNLRHKLFAKVEGLSMKEFKVFSASSLITRTTNDIEQLQRVTVMMLRMMLIAPLMAVGALFSAIQIAPSLSWIIGLAVVLITIMVLILFKATVPKFKILQQMVDQLNLVTRESLSGIRVIRAFNKERFFEGKFNKVNKDLKVMNLYINRWMMSMQPIMSFVMSLTLVAIVWFGMYQIGSSKLEVGSMMAFMQYSMQAITAFLQMSVMFIMIPRALVSANRVEEVLVLESSIKSPNKPYKNQAKPKGQIEFKNVNFGYPDADELVLTDVSFVAKPGKTTAIIGSTGSGKTALVDLIPRLYDATGGEVLLDGVSLKEWDLQDLSKNIGYVPQKANLFSGTISENVGYGNAPVSQDSVNKSLKIAQAEEFVSKLKDKEDSEVSQGGKNFSGGQRQRLSIARALAKKPSVLILDDSLSALDFKTDAKLRKELSKLDSPITQVVVGQRISNIMNADQIIVLDKGRVVGRGTHKELLKNNKVYQEMAQSQMSEEELKDD